MAEKQGRACGRGDSQAPEGPGRAFNSDEGTQVSESADLLRADVSTA